MINNRAAISICPNNDLPCAIDWCDHEAHYHLHAATDVPGDEDFHGDFCCRHIQSMLQHMFDVTEEKWSSRVLPERPDVPAPPSHLTPKVTTS